MTIKIKTLEHVVMNKKLAPNRIESLLTKRSKHPIRKEISESKNKRKYYRIAQML